MLEQALFHYKRFQEMVEKGVNRGFPEFPRTPSTLVFIYPLSFFTFSYSLPCQVPPSDTLWPMFYHYKIWAMYSYVQCILHHKIFNELYHRVFPCECKLYMTCVNGWSSVRTWTATPDTRCGFWSCECYLTHCTSVVLYTHASNEHVTWQEKWQFRNYSLIHRICFV